MSIRLVKGQVCLNKDCNNSTIEFDFGNGLELERLNFILGRNGSGKTLLATLLNPAITALIPTSKIGCFTKKVYLLLSILGYSYLKWPLPFRTCAHVEINSNELCVYGVIDVNIGCLHDFPSLHNFSITDESLQPAGYAGDKPYFSLENRAFDYFIGSKGSRGCLKCEDLSSLFIEALSYVKQCNDYILTNCSTNTSVNSDLVMLYYSPHLALVRAPLNLLPFYVANLASLNGIGTFNNNDEFVINLNNVRDQDLREMFKVLAKVFGIRNLASFSIRFKASNADVKVSYKLQCTNNQEFEFEPWQIGDGQRAFIQLFLTALAAKTAERQGLKSIFILDSPEAFMHPDLLEAVGELLALLETKHTIMVITQSSEALEEIITHSSHLENINITMLLRRGNNVEVKTLTSRSDRGSDERKIQEVIALLISGVDLRKSYVWRMFE